MQCYKVDLAYNFGHFLNYRQSYPVIVVSVGQIDGLLRQHVPPCTDAFYIYHATVVPHAMKHRHCTRYDYIPLFCFITSY